MAFGIMNRPNPPDNSEAKQQSVYIAGETFAGRAEVDSRRTGGTTVTDRDAAVSCPKMPQQYRDLGIAQPEYLIRQAFIMRPLPVDSQAPEP